MNRIVKQLLKQTLTDMNKSLLLYFIIVCVFLLNINFVWAQRENSGEGSLFDGNFMRWLSGNIIYPQAAIDDRVTGRVVVSFAILSDGRIVLPKIISSPHPEISKEVLRLLKLKSKFNLHKEGSLNKVKLEIDFSKFVDPDMLASMIVVNKRVEAIYGEDAAESEYKFMTSVKEKLVLPEQLKSIYVENDSAIIEYTITTKGVLENIKVVKSNNELLARAFVEAVAKTDKWTPAKINGQTHRSTQQTELIYTSKGEEEPFFVVEEMPRFKGGDLTDFRSWVISQIEYPQEAAEAEINGVVGFTFIIEKDGSVTNIKILKSPHELLSNEVIRILKKAPKWTPGRQRGRVVRVRYSLPIPFKIGNVAKNS